MKKIAKYLLSLAMVASVVVIPAASFAAVNTLKVTDLGTTQVESNISLGNKSPLDTATNLINTAMLFLGIIAVVIVLLGGFKWMTAMGSEEKITEARKLMVAGVVGIIFILSAWGIANYVLKTAVTVTTSGTATNN